MEKIGGKFVEKNCSKNLVKIVKKNVEKIGIFFIGIFLEKLLPFYTIALLHLPCMMPSIYRSPFRITAFLIFTNKT